MSKRDCVNMVCRKISNKYEIDMDSCVAQWVARQTRNMEVVVSSPVKGNFTIIA